MHVLQCGGKIFSFYEIVYFKVLLQYQHFYSIGENKSCLIQFYEKR